MIRSNIVVALAYLMMLVCKGHASLTVDKIPATIMKDRSSELDRPEGISFSPNREYIATANSHNNTITFYKRIEENVYETVPAFSIQGNESKLDFPHDLAFSPDGRHLAVANRQGNSITIYSNINSNNTPLAVIQIVAPNSVKYSPNNDFIAVANSHTITFHRIHGDIYDQTPYQMIKSSERSVLNSLDFSKDGEFLAIAAIDTHSVIIYQKNSDSYTHVQTLQQNLCYPHSVSFHPSGDYLVVSNAQGRKNVNFFVKGSSKPILTLEITQMYEESTIHLIDQLHRRGGCKGVAFSSDGTCLAVTQNLSTPPFSVNVLLVYPVEIKEMP